MFELFLKWHFNYLNYFQLIGCIGHFLRKNYRKSRNLSRRSIINPIKSHFNRISEKKKEKEHVPNDSNNRFICCRCFKKNRKKNVRFSKRTISRMDIEKSLEQKLMSTDNRADKMNDDFTSPKLTRKDYSGDDMIRRHNRLIKANITRSSSSSLFHNQSSSNRVFHSAYDSRLSLEVKHATF